MKEFSEQALKIINQRYVAKDEALNAIEDYQGMFRRVANTLGDNPETADKLYEIMLDKKFTPAGRTLANAGGTTKLVSNCIVLHIKDSMDGIFTTLKDAALLQQQGCGLGFPFHMLRPAGTIAKKNRGIASGPVSFLKVYNQSFGVIKQNGRHGANMAIISVDHPDILEFIWCKKKEGDIQNFNISVGLTDKFMQAVQDNDPAPWMCQFPCNTDSKDVEYMLPRRIERDSREVPTVITPMTMTAKQLFDEIVNAAWTNGEPGVVFLDAANKTNPLPGMGRLHATNPCGEQFLGDGDVCNLGSLNLGEFVNEQDGSIKWDELAEAVRFSIMALDNVIDNTDHTVERVNETMRGNRRIGLGVMGWADMLIKLRIQYGSQESIQLAEKVMSFVNDFAYGTSVNRAKEFGNFPNIEKSIYWNAERDNKQNLMRNAARTTVAPTGSIAMMFDCSSGIEPHFAFAYKKTVMGGQVFNYVNEDLTKYLKQMNLYTDEIVEKLTKTGSVQDIPEIPFEIRKVFVNAMEISAEQHIRMQAAFQKHVDNSISKTINFPFEATKEEVRNGYVFAWQLGCKGCTVYRDGSRSVQVLETEATKDKNCKSGSCDI